MSSLASARPRSGGLASARLQQALGRVILYLVVAVLAFLFAMPLLWTVSTSLKTPAELFVFPPQLLPAGLRIENFPRAWNFVPFGNFYWNTAVVTVLGTLGLFIVAYGIVFSFGIYYMNRLIKQGPDTTEPPQDDLSNFGGNPIAAARSAGRDI